MSNGAFLWIFSRGIELGVIVLCLLPLRALLRMKVSRRFAYLLWATLPVNIGVSLVMKVVPKQPRVVAYMNIPALLVVGERTVQHMKWIWGVGVIFVMSVMMFRYIHLLRCLVGSVRMQKGIYVTDRIEVPFTMGILSPKIYLPFSLEEEYLESVILHERIHIARRDVWMKCLAVGILGLFWFQPVLWFAYRLFINDMEVACDEAVLRRKGAEFCKEYARTLVEVAYQGSGGSGVAIGYGNGEIKERIKNVMQYRSRGVKSRVIALIICCMFMVVTVPISWQVPRLIQVKNTNGLHTESNLTVLESGIIIKEIQVH